MKEADKIKMDRLEQMVDSLEKENKALRKEIFKHKLQNGEIENGPEVQVQDHSAEDILKKIRARNKAYSPKQAPPKKEADFAKKIWESFMDKDS